VVDGGQHRHAGYGTPGGAARRLHLPACWGWLGVWPRPSRR
jgi:hypothetical protein